MLLLVYLLKLALCKIAIIRRNWKTHRSDKLSVARFILYIRRTSKKGKILFHCLCVHVYMRDVFLHVHFNWCYILDVHRNRYQTNMNSHFSGISFSFFGNLLKFCQEWTLHSARHWRLTGFRWDTMCLSVEYNAMNYCIHPNLATTIACEQQIDKLKRAQLEILVEVLNKIHKQKVALSL